MENRVRQRRLLLRLSQKQLALMAGVPVSTISDIEHGAEPRVVTAILIARALNTSVEYLFLV